MRFFTLILLLCLSDISFGQAVWNGRTYNAPVCNKPNCAMCDAIRAQLAAQKTPQVTVLAQGEPGGHNLVKASNSSFLWNQYVSPTTEPQYTTTYETRAVTKQVKRCNGRTCWYETVTEYVQVPVRTLVQPLITSMVPDEVSLRSKVPTPAPKNDISLDLVPTPHDAVPILVSLLRPGPNDIFMEPGCGDGRVLKAVSKICTSIGIELNKDTAKLAKSNLGNEAVVLIGDATQADYTRATIVSMYLYPDVMEKIVPLLQPGTRIVSYCHTIPGIKCTEYTTNGHTFYVGVK